MKGAHFKSQLHGKVQLSSAQRGEKSKNHLLPIWQDNKTGLSEEPCKKLKCSSFKRLPFLLKLFFYLLFFHKAPQPPKSAPLSPAYHSNPLWAHVPIFPIAPLQLSKASTVLLNRETENSTPSLLLTFQSIIFDITWVMWSVFTLFVPGKVSLAAPTLAEFSLPPAYGAFSIPGAHPSPSLTLHFQQLKPSPAPQTCDPWLTVQVST